MLATESSVGKRLPTALYVHATPLEHAGRSASGLRGCARWLVGEVEGVNIIKLSTTKPKVSYLAYPRFEEDSHPALVSATYVRLRELTVDSRTRRVHQPAHPSSQGTVRGA